MNPSPTPPRRLSARPALGVAAAAALTLLAGAPAAATDISNQPLATRPNVAAKPNLLFILDDSGSMEWDYMPDDIGNSRGSSNFVGTYSAQCNGVAFDPGLPYDPPLKADGTSYPNASFTAAPDDGFLTHASATNLNNSRYYNYTGTQPKMGWVYDSSGPVRNSFYNECRASLSNPGPFTWVTITTSSSAELRQKYANWYAYYRKRYLLMRTAMGRAIADLDEGYRVGFSRINDNSVRDGDAFRDVKTFDATQRANFYASLYGAAPNGGTPLRKALSKAGQYFANKASGQRYDPVQYSCQRNFALLSTDGYWNSDNGTQLDGRSEIGQQDGTEDRPMRDDAKAVVTTTVTHTAPATQQTVTTLTRTRTAQGTAVTTSSSRGSLFSTCRLQYTVTTQSATRIDTQVTRSYTPQTGTASYVTTTVTTDGVVTSGPTDGPLQTGNWINTPGGTTTTDPVQETLGTWTAQGRGSTSCSSTPGDDQTVFTQTSAGSWGNAQTSTAPDAAGVTTGVFVAQPPVANTVATGGTPNTLADVAEYYYKSDLRNADLGNCKSATSNEDTCADIVPALDSDPATWQHMNTFTIGLGVSGTIPYDRNYLTQQSGAFVDLTAGRLDWPRPDGYDGASGNSGNATNVDDLWHAAVNGRGQYYSALNASDLSDAITGVVNSLQAVPGAAAAAATSTVDLVAGDDNQVYRASYTTKEWTGDLQAFSLNGSTGVVGSTPLWSAQAKLDTRAPASRRIYTKGAGGSGLVSFDYDTLNATQRAYFGNFCSQSGIVQCASLSGADQQRANDGANLVAYLRGDRSYEAASKDAQNNDIAALYRNRTHVLGDIINGAPVRVGKPPFAYGDNGYADFVTLNANRKPVVYVAANDGMVHAISVDPEDGGTELWAYVPQAVMPNLYHLADKDYATNHRYFADGAPVIGDIQVGGVWKTILVGGLGGGGATYYALDVTDPLNPALLWEFSQSNDANLGLSYGDPLIGKLADGTWAVAFTSGYNNAAGFFKGASGDGRGHLYVVNANTGALLRHISTGVGDTSAPSGLARVNGWITSRTDNTIERIYGGDLRGNLWRFDLDDRVPPNRGALKLATFGLIGGGVQPITVKPELVEIDQKAVVLVGTGRYLGATDIDDSTQQSLYAVKDPLTAVGWGDVRSDTTNFVQQTFEMVSTGSLTATLTDKPLDWATQAGWWVDFPHARERVNTDMRLLANTLLVATAIPSGDACVSGGQSWLYTVDASNGGALGNDPAGNLWSTTSLIAGMTLVRDASGNIRSIVQNTDGTITQKELGGASSGMGSARRSSWRELVN